MKEKKPVNTPPVEPTARADKAPPAVVVAALIATVQSVAAITFGLFLAYRTFFNPDNHSMVFSSSAPKWVGVGSALFLIICFGFVIFGAMNMIRGRKLGRGAVVLVELILVASSFQMVSGGATALGIVVLISALITLVLLMFIPASVQWAARTYT